MSTNLTHASMIPLIGGETLGAERAFGARPIHFMSYEPFYGNDLHILNHYDNEVPYYLLDKDEYPSKKADIVSSVCPCAGLSQISHGYGDHNENNKWMPMAAEYILGEYRPMVYWGENAPGLAGKIGENIRNNLINIGQKNGYKFSIFRTKSLFHGVPQVRNRTFYFFWKGDDVPIFEYYRKPYTPIEELITNIKSNFQTQPINKNTPSKDPTYRYVLEVIHGGMSHREFSEYYRNKYKAEEVAARDIDVNSYIEAEGHTYEMMAEWCQKEGLTRDYEKNLRRHSKLASGGNIMRRGVMIPNGRIGAFVGHYPTMLAHPVEDRFINYREAMSIMGMPENFELVDASQKNFNHICQNVPVQTAEDMANEVIAAIEGRRERVKTDYLLQNNISKTLSFEEKGSSLEDLF